MNASVVAIAIHWFAAGPFGPIDQDPDAVRAAACELVEPADVCQVTPRPTFDPDVPAPTTSGGGGGGVLGVVLWGLLIIVVVALCYVVVRTLRDRAARRADDAELDDDNRDDDDDGGDAAGANVAIDRSREPLDWRTEAEAHRAAGRYRDALRCRYRALVGDLARRGLLDEIPGRTSGEERVQFDASAPDAAAGFRAAADLFDGAWYGDIRVSAADDDGFQQIDRDVLARAPTRSQGANR